MPSWLQGFAAHQPVSVMVYAARSLMVGGVYHSTRYEWAALAWIGAMLVVLVPLAVWKYRRST